MTDLRSKTLERLHASEFRDGATKAARWLMAEETQPLSEKPIEVRAHEVLELWRTRIAISSSKGHTLDGAPELLASLKDLDPRVKLEQVGFAGPQWMGNIFFKKADGEFVGSVKFDTPDTRENMQRAS